MNADPPIVFVPPSAVRTPMSAMFLNDGGPSDGEDGTPNVPRSRRSVATVSDLKRARRHLGGRCIPYARTIGPADWVFR